MDGDRELMRLQGRPPQPLLLMVNVIEDIDEVLSELGNNLLWCEGGNDHFETY